MQDNNQITVTSPLDNRVITITICKATIYRIFGIERYCNANY